MPYQVFWQKLNVFDGGGNVTLLDRGDFLPDELDAIQVSNLATIGAVQFVDVALTPAAVVVDTPPIVNAEGVVPEAPGGEDEVVDTVIGTVGEGAVLDGPDPDSAATKPHKSDSKAEWVEWATGQGMSEEDASASTKDELIAKFG